MLVLSAFPDTSMIGFPVVGLIGEICNDDPIRLRSPRSREVAAPYSGEHSMWVTVRPSRFQHAEYFRPFATLLSFFALAFS